MLVIAANGLVALWDQAKIPVSLPKPEALKTLQVPPIVLDVIPPTLVGPIFMAPENWSLIHGRWLPPY